MVGHVCFFIPRDKCAIAPNGSRETNLYTIFQFDCLADWLGMYLKLESNVSEWKKYYYV